MRKIKERDEEVLLGYISFDATLTVNILVNLQIFNYWTFLRLLLG